MRTLLAVTGVAGALLIPSSSAPDNAHLQREIASLRYRIVSLENRVTTLETEQHDLKCFTYSLADELPSPNGESISPTDC